MSRFKNAQEIHAENGVRAMQLENMKIEELFKAHMDEAHPEKQMPEPRHLSEKQECFTYDDMRHAFARGWHASKHVSGEGMRAAMQSSASSSCAAKLPDGFVDTMSLTEILGRLQSLADHGNPAVLRSDKEAPWRIACREAVIALKSAVPESGQINVAGQEESSEEAVVKPAQDAARTPAPAAPTPRTDEVQDGDTITLCIKLRTLARQLERELAKAKVGEAVAIEENTRLKIAEASRSASAEPDGYAALLDDKHAPKGFWWAGVWHDEGNAKAIAEKGKQGARIVPVWLAPRSSSMPSEGSGGGDAVQPSQCCKLTLLRRDNSERQSQP